MASENSGGGREAGGEMGREAGGNGDENMYHIFIEGKELPSVN